MFTDLFTGKDTIPRMLSEQERARYNANVGRIGRVVRKEHGLILTAHPHVDSHLETEADIENLLAATDPQEVALPRYWPSRLWRR
jgi:inosose dehydratase